VAMHIYGTDQLTTCIYSS